MTGHTKRDAVKIAYDVSPDASIASVDQMAQKVEKREPVLHILKQAEQEAQEALIDVMRYSSKLGSSGTRDGASYANVAVTASNSVLDRIHGKAKQSIDMQVNSVTIDIDLTSDDVIDI